MSTPKIPIDVQRKMHAFFLKTSAPRLLAKEKEEAKEKKVIPIENPTKMVETITERS